MNEIINTYIRPSKIHGVGLFALVDIEEGEEIIQGKADLNRFTDEWIRYNKNGEKSLALMTMCCCINHSDYPNSKRKGASEEDQLIIIADRLILKDCEITEDYFSLPDWNNPFATNFVSELIDKIIKEHGLE